MICKIVFCFICKASNRSKNDVKIEKFYKSLHNFYKLQNKKNLFRENIANVIMIIKNINFLIRLPNWPQHCLSGTHAVLTSMSSMTFQGRESFFSSSKVKLKSQNMYLRNKKKFSKSIQQILCNLFPPKTLNFRPRE